VHTMHVIYKGTPGCIPNSLFTYTSQLSVVLFPIVALTNFLSGCRTACQALTVGVLLLYVQPGVFDFGSRSSPVVLLLDRCDDPVTPLLMQWTYQVSLAHTLRYTCTQMTLLCPMSCVQLANGLCSRVAACAGAAGNAFDCMRMD
jgi:hypothetical protein